MILGISNLDLIFTEAYYEGLEGGILEAFAKLFPDNTRLYIYPYKSLSLSTLAGLISSIVLSTFSRPTR
jgi:hypothetical protein